MKLADIIDVFVSGDWGNDIISENTPNAVFCIRGADIVPITNNDFANIPQRFISERSLSKLLQVGDIVIEKSGGSPTQSTGRVVFISEALIQEKGKIVCSNFCTAFRVKQEWKPYFVYQYWQHIYNSDIFFNFEGKTSGIKNLQLETALTTIEIKNYPTSLQEDIANTLLSIDLKLNLNRAINQNLRASREQSKLVLNCRGAAVNADVSRNLEAILDRSLKEGEVRLVA